jgi:hypothetical protein
MLANVVFAQPAPPETKLKGPTGAPDDPARFAEFKQLMLKMQEDRIKAMQNGMSCIQEAQDRLALDQCMHQERKPGRNLHRPPQPGTPPAQ